jgi:rhodanese-related sulfurtransferase
MVFRPVAVPTVDVGSLPAGAHMLDVREDDEWRAGHVAGAQHIPLGDVPARVAEVPEGTDVYVICKAGGRSAQATRFLIDSGRGAVNVAGGMLAWEAAGRPMVADSAQPPYVA